MIRVKLKISIFALIDSISLINQRTMTIQQLEYILAVDQFRHFAKAAEYCRVTQPTLSAMIQKLEDELGSGCRIWIPQLCERGRRGSRWDTKSIC